MLKQKYFLTGIFILSAERQPIKLAWRKIVWLHLFPFRTEKLSTVTPMVLRNRESRKLPNKVFVQKSGSMTLNLSDAY